MITEHEKKRLRHHVRTSKRWVRTAWYFEAYEVGIKPVQLVDEEGMFDNVQGLKNAKKRLRSKALERFKVLRALDGNTYQGTAAPWDNQTHDPRPRLGPWRDVYLNAAAYVFPQRSPLKNLNVPIVRQQVARTLTAQPVATKTSSP